MGEVRDALADNVAEVLMFLGFALLFLGGSIGLELVAVLGIVTFFAAIFLSDPIEALLQSDDGTADDGTANDAKADDATADDPIAELRGRYARGEIDEVEFERRLDGLLESEDLEETVERDRDRAVEFE